MGGVSFVARLTLASRWVFLCQHLSATAFNLTAQSPGRPHLEPQILSSTTHVFCVESLGYPETMTSRREAVGSWRPGRDAPYDQLISRSLMSPIGYNDFSAQTTFGSVQRI
jgi:hypothetical protein